MPELLERPRTWEIDDDLSLHRLWDGDATEPSTEDLRDTYFDTADGDLRSHGAELRRHERGEQNTWILDAFGETIEVHADQSAAPPAELVEALTGLRLGKPLTEVATIHVTRETHRMGTADAPRVEINDEHVHASMGHRLLAWRQLAVTPGSADGGVPRRVLRALTKAGARVSTYSTVLDRVSPLAQGDAPRVGSAQRAFLGYAAEQIDAVFAGDVLLRRGQDPIHDTRVAIRRLRSTLRVFAPLLDATAIAGLEDELKWFAGLLGEVRDREVQRRRFADALDEWPPELVLGPVRKRLDGDLLAEQLTARRVVTDAMASERYLQLLAVLQRWRTAPPLRGRIDYDALAKRARRAETKADKRLTEALASGEATELHRARKAAKRARYAAELRQPLTRKAARSVKRYKEIQTILGDHQDSVVASDILRRMAVTAGTTPGENGFTYGLLYAREQQVAADARQQIRALSR